jgi:hypothetical protein
MALDVDRLTDAAWEATRAVGNGATVADAKARMRAFMQAIVDEIQENATIESLSTTSTPAGAGPHVHDPATVEATGKIR